MNSVAYETLSDHISGERNRFCFDVTPVIQLVVEEQFSPSRIFDIELHYRCLNPFLAQPIIGVVFARTNDCLHCIPVSDGTNPNKCQETEVGTGTPKVCL